MNELLKVENLYESIYESDTSTLDLNFQTHDLDIWVKHIEVDEEIDEFFLDSQENLDLILKDIEDGRIEIRVKINSKDLSDDKVYLFQY